MSGSVSAWGEIPPGDSTCATTAQRGDRDVEPVDSLQPCCTRDEGGPLEAGMQVQASNPLELRG